MITLLSKLFIKDYKNTSDDRVRRSYGVVCGSLGIFLNILLFTIKFIAGMISSSIAITADAFNNLSDAGSSLITLIGFRLSGQAPDKEHPFGHGRFEYLSGFIVSLLILLMGFELLKSSIDKLLHPEEITFNIVLVVILSFSILTKLYMVLYNRKVSRLIASSAMKATATDSLSDSLATTVVLITTLISHFFNINIDAVCGIAVALFILYAGISAAKETINPLLGKPPEKEFVKKIYDLVATHSDIVGIHDLIVHDYGPGRLIISLHAEVPASGNMLALHDTIDNLEHELSNNLGCLAVIHMDPIETEDEVTCELKQKVTDIVAELDSSMTIHDFRVVVGPTHTNLIFDVLVPPEYKYDNLKLREELSGRLKALNQSYNAVIEIDREYTTSTPVNK